MGVQFEIVDRRNRRRFDLDKLYVHGLDTGAAMTPAQVLAAYNDASAKRYGAKDPQEEDYRDIASRVWAFCEVAGWDVWMWNDHADDNTGNGYPLVDGRSTEPFDPDPCAEATAAATLSARAQLGLYS